MIRPRCLSVQTSPWRSLARKDLLPRPSGRACSSGGRINPRVYARASSKAEEDTAADSATRSTSLVVPFNQVDKEIFGIALPTLATLAADPLAGLVSTAWVGRLGAAELAAVGVALSVYNVTTKLFNVPLLSVTTSIVAQALGKDQGEGDEGDRVSLAVSAALALAIMTGLVEALVLELFGVEGLMAWGAGPSSPLHGHAVDYLLVRAISAPATVLFITLQGAFRGLGDTRAPFYATLSSNLLNIVLEPILIFGFGWGVKGAAGAIVVAQVLSSAGLMAMLSKRCKLRLAGRQTLQDSLQYLAPTGLMTVRTLLINGTFAVGTGVAARTDELHTAAHQVCFQVWLATGMLADSLAVAAQSLLARSLAARDKETARAVVARTATLAAYLGFVLVALLGAASPYLPRLFTNDEAVLAIVDVFFPAVVATQPLNSLAFLADGVLYGVGGFRYAAQVAMVASVPSIAIMLLGSSWVADNTGDPNLQLYPVWGGMAALMVLRTVTIFLPYKLRLRPFDKLAD